MGKGTKAIKYGSKLEFLNRHQEKFDWENGELDDDGVLVQEEPIAHPGIPAEIPGVMLESDYEELDGGAAVQDEPAPTIAQRTAVAAASAGIRPTLVLDETPNSTGVDHSSTGVLR